MKDLIDLENLMDIDDTNLYNFYNKFKTDTNLQTIKLIVYLKILNLIKYNGGETGIQQERVALCRFQDRCFQPLSHLSVSKVYINL